MRTPLKALLFDLDGTLADTEPTWLAAKAAVARRHGIDWSEADGIASIGQATELYSAEFVRRGATGSVRDVGDEISAEVARRLSEGVSWRPGALELLLAATAEGVATALVTMSYRGIAETVRAQVPGRAFDVIVAGDDVSRSKPHPEPYLTALAALGVSPGEAVAIEDTQSGASSAEAAGLRTVVVPSHSPVVAAPRRWITDSLSLVDLPMLRALLSQEQELAEVTRGTR
ncbi:HAD family hydrolase [Demequina lignilytica]|uniref:HAD family phosphatase n=1 Tax=Demequina lignilytica TaxID=3051663 RepID=A0AB35MIW8_9MICO|nr:HAD family phosphatase [Demequina sp. SYSU T0a273]MDN4483692.1 HAD family phosphatase [Demequina sp. SYSU T0a273]